MLSRIVVGIGKFFVVVGLVLEFFTLLAFASALFFLRNFVGKADEEDESPPVIDPIIEPVTPAPPPRQNVVNIEEFRERLRQRQKAS